MEPLVWVVIGLIAGWLAGLVMKGSGYGLVGDLVVGGLGGLVGAWLFIRVVPPDERAGPIGTVIVALVAAVLFIGLARLLTRRSVRA